MKIGDAIVSGDLVQQLDASYSEESRPAA